MADDLSRLLAYPASRLDNIQHKIALERVAELIATTNDPESLRALGKSLKMMGDLARTVAFDVTKDAW